jgi:glycosyltransferase involved in cell wall biosynthesis
VVVAGSAPAELVPDQTAGLHVPPRSCGALAVAITQLVEEPERRKRMSAAASSHAMGYSWHALVDRLEAALGAQPALGIAAR